MLVDSVLDAHDTAGVKGMLGLRAPECAGLDPDLLQELGAFEAGDSGEQNRRKGQGQAQEKLRDEQIAKLTVVGRGLNGP